MHIALVIEQYDPAGGGAERSTAQIAAELTRRGHRVTVLAGRANRRPRHELEGVRVVAWSQAKHFHSAWRMWGFARWARRQLQSGGFDTSLSVTTAVPAAVVQPRGGTVRETRDRNLAIRPHRRAKLFKRLALALSPKHHLLLALEKRTLTDPMVRKVVAVSRYVVEQLQRHYGIGGDRVTVIPNAAEMPRVTAEEREAARQRVRQYFHVPEGAVVYLFAALNPRLKGYGTLVKATKLLTQRGVPAVVLLAGAASYAMQHQAAAAGIRDRVRFIGPTGRIVDLYCAADVTVLPTYYDPSSKVVIESLMLGVPAITTRFNGAADLVCAPDAAPRGRVIADPADYEALAQAMAQMADPAERARCAAATAGLAESLSMTRHVERLEQVLREAAG